MNNPLVTIVIPYAYNTKWLQILLASLKETDIALCQIWVMNNTPQPDRSIDGIKKTSLGDGVRIYDVPSPRDWHGGCIDYALPDIETPFFMMMESDCQAVKASWLDNFLIPIEKDNLVAMAGWFWPGGDRNYIGPGATIYDTQIVKSINEEVQRNKKITFCYGDGLKQRHTLEPRMLDAKWLWGPFTETRSYHDIVKREEKWWQEPCAWLYYRCSFEYECVWLPGVFSNQHYNGVNIANATYYGSLNDHYFIHHWGGTVSHNWEKQKVTAPWELAALPYWIAREDNLWQEIVPESIRRQTLDMGLVKTGDEEMDFILNHENVLKV